jgi:hypothetical protein
MSGVQRNASRFATLSRGRAAQRSHESRSTISRSRRAVSRFWRWLTCGHGLHQWKLGAAVVLEGPPLQELTSGSGEAVIVASRWCPRCGEAVVLE